MKFFSTALLLAAGTILSAVEPVFQKDFSKVSFNDGSPIRKFDAKGIIAPTGTMIFRVQSNWDGLPAVLGGPEKYYTLFSAETMDGKETFPVWFWTWLRADVPSTAKPYKVEIKSGTRGNVVKNDTMIVAVVWNRRTRSTVYVNGCRAGEERFTTANVKNIKSFIIGSMLYNNSKFNGKIESVRIYNKGFSEAEIKADYLKQAVFDFNFNKNLYVPGRQKIAFEVVAPCENAGFRKDSVKSVSGKLTAKLLDENDKVVLTKDFGTVKTTKYGTKLEMPEIDLKQGHYRLELTAESAGKKIVRAFRIAAYTEKPAMAAPAAEPFKLGKPVFEKVFPGKYKEGPALKMANFAFEIPIPAEYRKGGRLIIEVEWPDDKPRNMAFYMYPEKGSHSTIRDRLGQGISTGNEYRNSGKMMKVQYPFIAGSASYLFEVRTMSNGKPGAVKAVRVYPQIGEFAELKVNYPKGLPCRRIGHLDEDQSCDYNFDWDGTRPKINNWIVDARIVRHLVQYLKMTGQNSFSMPILRYDWSSFQTGSMPSSRGVWPFHTGAIPAWVETFADNGITTTFIVNLWGAPGMSGGNQTNFKNDDWYTRLADGSYNKSNPFHPEVRKLYLAEIREMLRRFGNLRGLDGIDLWFEWCGMTPISLEIGYDDTTMKLFSKETGVKVPDFDSDIFAKRKNFLTTGKVRAKWIRWRAAKTTELIREVRKIIDQYNPKLRLYITSSPKPYSDKDTASIETLDIRRDILENTAIDLNAIERIKNVYYIPMRRTCDQRWWEHWNNSNSSTTEAAWKPEFAKALRSKGMNFTAGYRKYFESFKTSPSNDKYPAYFQNNDLKAPGRLALFEYSLALALEDSMRIQTGAQPLTSFGIEREIREFAKAFCALPEIPFKDIPNATDPVTVRYLNTKNGTYLYAVNMVPVKTTVQLAGFSSMQDLSTLAKAGKTIELKPFELRSFLIPGKVKPVVKEISVPADYVKMLAAEVKSIAATVEALEKAGAPSAVLKAQYACLKKAFDAKAYANTERLLFSKTFREVENTRIALSKGWLQKQTAMLKRSHYAVNNGSIEFFQASDGRLFFPDGKWSVQTGYGYMGTPLTVTRSIAQIPDSNPLKKTFETELYRFREYRFSVKPGKYTVRLHMRAGYEPARKPGAFGFTLAVNGKEVEKKYDIFTHEKNGTALLELKGVNPVDGLIRLNFTPMTDPTSVLLNAIEVIPE